MLAKVPAGVGGHSNYTPPSIITVITKSIRYKISYELMEKLNYTDLLYMIIDYEIIEVKNYLSSVEKDRQSRNGVEVIDATPEQATAFFRRG